MVGEAHIYIRAFGHFDIFLNDSAVCFHYPKAKELLALLVDRKGGFISAREAIGCLWEDMPADKTMHAKYRKTAMQLNQILDRNGISHIVEYKKGMRRVIPNSFDCDYYSYLEGNATATQKYTGQYMVDYSWAEETIATLDDIKTA